MTGPLAFSAGEMCLFVDNKGRHYLSRLRSGERFQYHGGALAHDDVIGAVPGSRMEASAGLKLLVLRPRLSDYVLSMRHGPQVVYPKDIGPILVWGDIGPGNRVLEAGTGSGALTLALTRAVGATGSVVSVERRPDHAEHARKAIERFFGGVPDQLTLVEGDVVDLVGEVAPDRIVLDVPEPWHVVEPAARHLQPGGVFTSYLPTVPQVQQLRDALRTSRRFLERTTFEVLHREWAAEGRSVRPASQMVGHTGFITVARQVERWGTEPEE